MRESFKKWIAALRSGKYAQAQHALRNENGFCCLGVACDIYDPTRWDKERMYLDHDIDLPPEVNEEYGFPLEDADYAFEVSEAEFTKITGLPAEQDMSPLTLISLNDTYGLTFDQIADVMEEYHERFVS